MSDTKKEIPVVLGFHEWKVVLTVLEDGMQICNRDQKQAIWAWEEIMKQINGEPVHLIHSQNPNPDWRPKPKAVEKPVEAPVENPSKKFLGIF